MNFGIAIKESFRAILRNRMRSFLTCVGIVVGIAAVILVPALGNCAKVVMVRQLEAFGTCWLPLEASSGFPWARD